VCAECFKSCPHDNVSFAIRRGKWKENFANYGQAWQAIVMLVLGMVYPLTILSPWAATRDMVNVVDKATWSEFGVYAACLWTVTLGLVPLIFWTATRFGMKWSKTDNEGLSRSQVGQIFKKTMPTLIPLGLTFWMCFFVATFMVNLSYILLSISDPFGHGWDLLGIAGMPWVQVWPSGIPWIQAFLILTGISLSLRKGHQIWYSITQDKHDALRGFVPTAAVIITLAATMLVYFTNF
jgi:hypothetical protein